MSEEPTASQLTPDEREQSADMLEKLREEASTQADARRREAGQWEARNLQIGLPAALLAGGGGVTALASEEGWPEWVRVAAALGSVLGGGLAGVATTLNASRRAETALVQAASLDAVRREIEQLQVLDLRRFDPEEMRDAIDQIVRWMNDINGLPARASTYQRWLERRKPTLLKSGETGT